MEKLYGYNHGFISELAEFMKGKKGRRSDAFSEFAQKTGKSKGTVRNAYYAMVKKAGINAEFCKEKFGDHLPTVRKSEKFSEEESRELLIKILRAKAEGVSVRRAVLSLSGGDAKVALRYQNKFRSLMRVKPNGKTLYAPQVLFKEDDAIKRLKDGIDGLIGRISEKTQKENRTLKERLEYLEKENLRLCNILYGGYHQEKGDRNHR